jgi:hypothetical protein
MIIRDDKGTAGASAKVATAIIYQPSFLSSLVGMTNYFLELPSYIEYTRDF